LLSEGSEQIDGGGSLILEALYEQHAGRAPDEEPEADEEQDEPEADEERKSPRPKEDEAEQEEEAAPEEEEQDRGRVAVAQNQAERTDAGSATPDRVFA
jgi:hypothetical protein